MKVKLRSNAGMSIFETVVVIAIFAVIGILITAIIFLSVSGTKRGDSLMQVRQNLNYATSIMERQLRNAQAVTSCDPTKITYKDQDGKTTVFECQDLAGQGYVSSDSARLTGSEIKVTGCSFNCEIYVRAPTSVTINLVGQDPNLPAVTNASLVTVSTRVTLRSYSP